MRLAAVQFKAQKGRKEASLTALRRLAVDAATAADVVVLPEMAGTGYLFSGPAEVRRVAEPARGDTFRALAPIARERSAWIVAGFPEAAADRLFNSALVIDPAGDLRFVYRKTLLFEADRLWATPGDSGYARFDASGGSFGVGICMDLNDDRFVAWCARSRVDVVALSACWLEEGLDVHAYWASRAVGIDGVLAVANAWGREGGVCFAGASAVLHRGRVLAAAPHEGNSVVRAVLSRTTATAQSQGEGVQHGAASTRRGRG